MRSDIRTIIRETAARYGVLALAILVSLGGKAALLAAQAVPFNADEAVVGLMAKHILQGERPIFFYGQAYMGSLDAFLAAAGFALFGPQVWIIRAVQAGLFAGTMILWHKFCAEAYGSLTIARLAVLLLAVPPVFLTLYTTISLGGYGEALFFGSLSLLLAIQIVRGKTNSARWFGLGLSAGIGFWSFPLSLLLTLPACAVALAYKPRTENLPSGSRLQPRLALLCAGGILGVLPWIIGVAQLGIPALQELGGSAIAGTLTGNPATVFSLRMLNFFLFGASTWFGLRPSWELRWLIPALLPIALTVNLAVIALAAGRLRVRDGAQPARWMLAGSVLLLFLVYLFTPFGNDPSGRYFLPLGLILTACAAEFTVRAATRIGRAAYLIPLLLLVYQAAGTIDCASRIPPGITTQFDSVAQLDQRDLPRVIDFLRQHGETRGYTNYWVSFPLAFESGEDLIFTARLPYHPDLNYTSRDDRYPPYDDMVGTADQVAYITTNNPTLDALLESTFLTLGIQYQIEQIGDFRIYYDLSRPVRPEEIF